MSFYCEPNSEPAIPNQMTQKFTEQAVRYFLGELSESEQSTVEERFFTDEDYSRFLDETENELVADYVGGRLDFRQTQSFERDYLISESRREKVRRESIRQSETFAGRKKALFQRASTACVRQRFERLLHVPNLIPAALAILILLGGSPFVTSPEKNQTERAANENKTITHLPILPPKAEKSADSKTVRKQTATRKSAVGSNAEKSAKRRNAPRREPPVSSFTFLPPAQSAEKRQIDGARKGENIRLRIEHGSSREFISYRVEIRAADGDLIWSREISASRKTLRKPIFLDVRRDALLPGSYELTVSGATVDAQFEEVNFYNFTVR